MAHQLNTNNSLQLIIYIDVASVTAQRLINYFLKERDFREITIEFTPLEEALIHKNLLNPDKKTTGRITQLIFDRFSNLNIAATDARINQVLCLIKDIPPAELSIDDLASRVFISPSRLRMQFKEVLGVSLHQYIIRQRIITAITHIINGLSIQQAAYNSGFNDSSHFNKLMRKIFHISPSMFLNSNKNFSVIKENNSVNLITELV